MKINRNLTFELVTPAFSGQIDSDPRYPEGFSGRCLKPLLRYWWRALNPIEPGELRRREAEIFGSTEKGQLMTVRPMASNFNFDTGTDPGYIPPHSIIGYCPEDLGDVIPYLGYGVLSRKKDHNNLPHIYNDAPMYRPRREFSFSLGFRQEYRQDFEAALWMFSVFGGWGRRTRRGFGSLRAIYDFESFPKLEADSVDQAHEVIRKGLEIAKRLALQSTGKSELPECPGHTALCRGFRVLVPDVEEFYKDSKSALNALGDGFYRYRRSLGAYFNHCAPNGCDHDERYRYAGCNRPPTNLHPLQATQFGLPLNAKLRGNGKNADVSCESGRRGSPLFMSVVGFGPDKLLPVIAYFPAEFLPAGNNVNIKVHTAGNPIWQADFPSTGDDKEITKFLNGLDAGSCIGCYQFPKAKWEEIV